MSFQDRNVKEYRVKRIETGIDLIKDNNSLWKKAIELTDFTYPWDDEAAPLTSFKALHNEEWLFCFFNVEDKNINVLVEKNLKKEVIYSDRVEIFFRKDSEMLPYYCLEMDPYGRVYDYEAFYHRKFNADWSWPEGQLKIKGSIVKDGYIVAIAINKKSLRDLGLLKGNMLEAGLFRGNCIELKPGQDSEIKWISWMKPDSPTPDFHIPSAFGRLVLE